MRTVRRAAVEDLLRELDLDAPLDLRELVVVTPYGEVELPILSIDASRTRVEIRVDVGAFDGLDL